MHFTQTLAALAVVYLTATAVPLKSQETSRLSRAYLPERESVYEGGTNHASVEDEDDLEKRDGSSAAVPMKSQEISRLSRRYLPEPDSVYGPGVNAARVEDEDEDEDDLEERDIAGPNSAYASASGAAVDFKEKL